MKKLGFTALLSIVSSLVGLVLVLNSAVLAQEEIDDSISILPVNTSTQIISSRNCAQAARLARRTKNKNLFQRLAKATNRCLAAGASSVKSQPVLLYRLNRGHVRVRLNWLQSGFIVRNGRPALVDLSNLAAAHLTSSNNQTDLYYYSFLSTSFGKVQHEQTFEPGRHLLFSNNQEKIKVSFKSISSTPDPKEPETPRPEPLPDDQQTAPEPEPVLPVPNPTNTQYPDFELDTPEVIPSPSAPEEDNSEDSNNDDESDDSNNSDDNGDSAGGDNSGDGEGDDDSGSNDDSDDSDDDGNTGSSDCADPNSPAIKIDANWLADKTAPYYLDQAGATYHLNSNVSTPGTAFSVMAPDITFDLCGNTITYNDALPRKIANHSFEEGSGTQASGWDQSMAPNSERFQGEWLENQVYDGEYSLKFNLPAEDQFITSMHTVILEPKTTYVLSGMFWRGNSNTDVKLYIELIGVNGEPTRKLLYNKGNNRGIQFAAHEFTTGAMSEAYTIRVGLLDASSAQHPVYIDDIKITRTKTYGVAMGSQSWAAGVFPGLTRYGLATNGVLKNGQIIQGQDRGSWSPAVNVRSSANVMVTDMDLTIYGVDTNVINIRSSNATSIIDNVLHHLGTIVSNRDQQYGSVIMNTYSPIMVAGNVINGGPQIGINLGGEGPHEVFNNVIKLKISYTNGFGIMVRGPGSKIYDNLIDCIDGFYCRGIMVGRGSVDNYIDVFRNIVNVELIANSQEYRGVPLGGTYGIQLENAAYVNLFDNFVTAFGRNAVKAYAFRVNSGANKVYAYNNTFKAVSEDARAAALKFGGLLNDHSLIMRDNIIITNDGIAQETAESEVELVNTQLDITPPTALPYAFLFEIDWSRNTALHAKLRFVNNSYVNSLSRNSFESGVFRSTYRYQKSGPPTDRGAFSAAYTTNIIVRDALQQPLPNVDLQIKNAQGVEVFNGQTDQDGQVSLELDQFFTQGANKTDYNSYTLIASYNSEERTKVFEVTDQQILFVDF